jgi:cytochrome c7-like protein
VLLAALCCSPLAAQSKPLSAGNTPVLPPPQPIPFSHRVHSKFITDCYFCHEFANAGWDLTYPAESKCMVCHASLKAEDPGVKKLIVYFDEKKPVPWVRVYQVPDYVFFSHKVHVTKGKIGCDACHGPVAERDELAREKPTSMQACIDCHKEKHALATCRSCHER